MEPTRPKKIVVVGGGLYGLSTSYYLSLLKPSSWADTEITLLEREHDVGMKTSHLNCGMATYSVHSPPQNPKIGASRWKFLTNRYPPIQIEWTKVMFSFDFYKYIWHFVKNSNETKFKESQGLLYDLKKRNYHLYQAFLSQPVQNEEEKQVINDIQYFNKGTFLLYADKNKAQNSFKGLDYQRKDLIAEGMSMEAVNSREEIEKKEPALKACKIDINSGILFHVPKSSYHSGNMCQALSYFAQKQGVKVHSECEVKELKYELNKDRKKVVKSVVTTDGREFPGDLFIFATGIWTRPLLKPYGPFIPIWPCKGYTAVFKTNIPINYNNLFENTFVSTCSLTDDKIHSAAKGILTSLNDYRLPPQELETMKERAQLAYGDNVDVKNVLTFWTGLRPWSCDGMGITGPVTKYFTNLYVNAGKHTGNGFLVCGELIAKNLYNGENNWKGCQPDRFSWLKG